MKMLVLTALIGAVIGCTKKVDTKVSEQRFEPKFSYQQEVTFYNGFLKGQTGKIIDAKPCVDDGQGTFATDGVCYSVKLTNEPDKTWSNVPERELQL